MYAVFASSSSPRATREKERGKIDESSHQDVENNADETSSRLARVIDDEEERKKEKERKNGRN